jgi:undecaprenyl-diphosphatase
MISAKLTGTRGAARSPRRAGRLGSVAPAARRPVARRLLGSAAAFAAVAGITDSMGGPLGDLDRAAMTALRSRRVPAVVQAARAVSALAEPVPVSVLLAACAAAHPTGWRTATSMGLTVVGGAHARRLLSKAIARPRPPAEGWLSEPEGFSFPSKHTTLAALTAGACARLMCPPGGRTWLPPLLAAAGVGASRVYLGVHWPTDVLAAWLFAEGCLRLADVPAALGRGTSSRLGRPGDVFFSYAMRLASIPGT